MIICGFLKSHISSQTGQKTQRQHCTDDDHFRAEADMRPKSVITASSLSEFYSLWTENLVEFNVWPPLMLNSSPRCSWIPEPMVNAVNSIARRVLDCSWISLWLLWPKLGSPRFKWMLIFFSVLSSTPGKVNLFWSLIECWVLFRTVSFIPQRAKSSDKRKLVN